MKVLIETFIIFLMVIKSISCLECGMNSGFNTTELRVLLTSCLVKENFPKLDVMNVTNNNETNHEDYDYNDYYLYNENSSEEKIKSEEATKKLTKNFKMDKELTTTDDYSKVFNDPGRCTYQCVFKKLNIIDDDGFPDHDKVSKNLITDVKNQELKDFFQDSIDECFQSTQLLGEELDLCDFSYNFFKCLAEKARENCSDWPIEDVLLSDLF